MSGPRLGSLSNNSSVIGGTCSSCSFIPQTYFIKDDVCLVIFTNLIYIKIWKMSNGSWIFQEYTVPSCSSTFIPEQSGREANPYYSYTLIPSRKWLDSLEVDWSRRPVSQATICRRVELAAVKWRACRHVARVESILNVSSPLFICFTLPLFYIKKKRMLYCITGRHGKEYT